MGDRRDRGVIVREATADDAAAVAAIYAYHVLTGAGTFEETPPSLARMRERIAEVQALGLPYRVVEDGGQVRAFAYAGPYRLRAAYRHTVEDSVYAAPGALRRGYGHAGLAAVIVACEALGVHQMMAVIGGSDNAGSIGLHRRLGFERKGVLKAVGFKAGRWVDVVLMQRALNGGAQAPPRGAGLTLGL